MPASTTKIELKGAKIVETPSATGVAVSANRLDAILASLPAAKEIENNMFDLDPSVTDQAVAMGNITDADVLILVPDGRITVKINGGLTALQIDTVLILFGTDITSLTASNPSATEVRQVIKYLASATT
jgi:hypothetical protein